MPVIFKKYYPLRNIIFFLGEGLLIFSVVTLVQVLLEGAGPPFFCHPEQVLRSIMVTLVFQLCLYFFDLYDLGILVSFSETATQIIQAFGCGCIILAAIYYFFPSYIISTKIFWTGFLSVCGGISLYRFVYLLTLRKRLFTEPIVLFGDGSLAEKIYSEIFGKMDSGYNIVAYISTNNVNFGDPENSSVIQDITQLPNLVKRKKAERIVVALEDRRGTTPIKELIACRLDGTIVNNGVDFYEKLTGKILVETANPDWIIYSGGFRKSRTSTFIKRLFDVTLASIGLLITFPLCLLSAIIIKVESPGSVLYRQKRVGERNHAFNVIKFRSMGKDAEAGGAVWASVNDNRVTRYGNFIRKMRIDEIPQMWNVLLGEMSFVGPRPERPMFVEELEKNIPYYSIRHSVKPGITGWAQICYPYGASEEDALRKLEYDLYYLKNISLSLDLWICFRTMKTILFKAGAR